MAIGIAAAVAVTAGVVTPAYAVEGLPLEENRWTTELADNVPLYSSETISEDYDGSGNLVQVWRGADNNRIWASINHGAPRAFDTAQTYAAPRIIHTDYGFRVFHTGTDGRIYYAGITVLSTGVISFGSWVQVPNNTLTHNYLPPSVTALPNGDWFLAWTGASGPDIWTLYYNANTWMYGAPARVDDGSYEGVTILSAPAVAYDRSWNQIVLAWRDALDGLQIATQAYGQSSWQGWRSPTGVQTRDTPSIALTNNGYGTITVLNAADHTLASVIINRNHTFQYWFNELTNLYTNHPAWVTAIGTVLYYIVTTTNQGVYYKRAGDLGGLPRT